MPAEQIQKMLLTFAEASATIGLSKRHISDATNRRTGNRLAALGAGPGRRIVASDIPRWIAAESGMGR